MTRGKICIADLLKKDRTNAHSVRDRYNGQREREVQNAGTHIISRQVQNSVPTLDQSVPSFR